MAIALVANAGAGSSDNNNVTTGAIDTTGADFLVAVLSSGTGSLTLTDSKSNTWTPLTDYNHSGIVSARIYYCAGATVGAGHTFTVTSTGLGPTVCVAAFSGVHATPFDQENGTFGGSSTTSQPGSVTPSENDELLITGSVINLSGVANAVDSGFAITDAVSFVTSQHFGGVLAYKIQTSAGAENPQLTYSASNFWAHGIATFKAAGGGGGGLSIPIAMRHYLQMKGAG